MGHKALGSHPIDRAIAEILDDALEASDYSLRALSRASGVRLTRLGDVLRRGKSMTTGEMEQISRALDLVPWRVIQEAERRIDTPERCRGDLSSVSSPRQRSNDNAAPDWSTMSARTIHDRPERRLSSREQDGGVEVELFRDRSLEVPPA